jgi:hypothetical protein
MAGGEATVAIAEDWQVVLTGTVTAVFQGSLAPEMKVQLEAL